MEPQNNVLNGTIPYSCWACGSGISSEDNYCKKCGKGQGSFVPWYYKHWGIVIITLFGLGPFSLYFIWRSPVISRNAKWLYTALIAGLTLYAGSVLYRAWMFFHSMLGGLQFPS